MEYLQEVLGSVYISTRNQDELLFNYSFLLQEKKSILNKIRNLLMLDEDTSITLEEYHIDLLMLQSDTILYDSNNNVIEYPNYYSKKQLTIINLLKKITYNPESLTQEEILLLIKFFKNRKLVEDILSSSVNGIKLNKRALRTVMTLFEGFTTTTNKNITTYESLCTKLSLTKKDTHTLKKVA